MPDLLAGAAWKVIAAQPGAFQHPSEVREMDGIPAIVPGTAAAAVRAARGSAAALETDYDGQDWWFLTTVASPEDRGAHQLLFRGVATRWTAWWDGELVVTGRSMFRSGTAPLHVTKGRHELALRCEALAAVVTPSRPRAPWRSNLVTDPAMRWHRTAGLGRIRWHGSAAAVGPWRPIELVPTPDLEVCRVDTALVADSGVVTVEMRALGVEPVPVVVSLDNEQQRAEVRDATVVRLTVRTPHMWWPHTHGEPRAYTLTVGRAGEPRPLFTRRVGFRTVTANRSDDGFSLIVNGVPVFARGVCWVPPDPLAFLGPEHDVQETLLAIRDSGANLVRVTGTTTWQDETFHELCTELGLMLWQDCMLHTLAPVEDAAWLEDLGAEVVENLRSLQGRPHLVVVSGGSETEQQPTLWGLPAAARHTTALEVTIPEAVALTVPAVVHVTSSPTGGYRPTAISQGISHYFGVGAYERPLSDARLAGVRFSAECLAFGLPPERPFVRSEFGTATRRGDLAWRRGIARDPKADWDFEQTTTHYAQTLFGLDIESVRRDNPERALDLLRAASVHVMELTLSEWRRPGSTCRGSIILSARDLTPGAGWGILDSEGGAKPPWFALRRVWSPRTVFVTDEGLDGLALHLLNDHAARWQGKLSLTVTSIRPAAPLSASLGVEVAGHGAVTLWAEELLDGFRDLTHAWRFGPAAYDALTVCMNDGEGMTTRTALLGGLTKPALSVQSIDAELGVDEQGWWLDLTSAGTLAFVVIETNSARPGLISDNWFHLAANLTRRVRWTPCGGELGPGPSGTIRAANLSDEVSFGLGPP